MDILVNRTLYMSCQAGPGIEPGPSALKASALPIELTWQTNTFCLDIICKFTRAITLIRKVHLDVNEQAIVDALIALIDVRVAHLVIDHFNNDDIVNMINEMSIAKLC